MTGLMQTEFVNTCVTFANFFNKEKILQNLFFRIAKLIYLLVSVTFVEKVDFAVVIFNLVST